MGSPRRTFLFLALAPIAISACDSSPASPDPEALRVEVVIGDGQRGLPGLPLPGAVIFEVTDGNGDLRPGVSLELRTAEGEGLVRPAAGTTNSLGRIEAEWTLGPADRPLQRLVATVGGDEATAAVAEATALGPDETDVVVVHGAGGPLEGVLVLQEPSRPATSIAIVQEWPRPIGPVIPLQPVDGGVSHVLVMPTANAPVLQEVTWTPGVDTVHVDLPPPVALDLEVHIRAGPFEETERIFREHLAVMAEILRLEGAGVRIGNVEVIDGVEAGGRVSILTPDCSRPAPHTSDVVRVEYIHDIGGGFGGFACSPDRAFMAESSSQWPRLLAHEIGHVFTLPHRSHGLMSPDASAGGLTAGEIFRIHFDENSAVNAVFQGHPVEVRRPCFGQALRCLPLTFEFGG